MTAIRIFSDEDIYRAVAISLRRAGFDAVSAPEVARLGETDESQLEWSARNRRAILTFNVAHFAALHTAWLSSGKHHTGIIVSAQQPLGEIIRRVLHLLNSIDECQLNDRLEFLSDW